MKKLPPLGMPLHCAIDEGTEEFVKLLVDVGIDVNLPCGNNVMPLHAALKLTDRRRPYIVRLLLEKGARIDIYDENGQTPLYITAKNGYLEEFMDILCECPDIDNEVNRRSLHAAVCAHEGPEFDRIADYLMGYGFTFNTDDTQDADLFHSAIERGYTRIVQLLLRLKTDVNMVHITKGGFTPLHTAALNKQFEITELLLRQGANVYARDSGNRLAITHAINSDDTATAKRLFNAMVRIIPDDILMEIFHAALKNVNRELVELILKKKNVNVNALDASGRTPFQFMALGCCRKTVFDEGILTFVDTTNDHRAIFKMLHDRGADVNARNKKGRTALHNACINLECRMMTSLLIELDADIDIKDETLVTPLHLAAYMDNEAVIFSLLENDVRLNERDILGRTPLVAAAKYKCGKAVQCLLLAGADFDIPCYADNTPLNYATHGKNHLSFDRPDEIYTGDEVKVLDDDDPFDVMGYGFIISILVDSIITAIALNRPVSEKNRKYIESYPDRDIVFSRCRDLISKMKETFVGDTKIRYYDIISHSINQVTFFAKNDSFVDGFNAISVFDNFLYYACWLTQRYNQALERAKKNLLGLGNMSLNVLCGYSVPESCSLEIFDYLSNKDLKNFIKAFPPQITEIDSTAEMTKNIDSVKIEDRSNV